MFEQGALAAPGRSIVQQWTVRDVLTPEVLTVDYDTPPAEVITTMTKYDVSALAVVDSYDTVLGIITRTDVLNGLAAEAVEKAGELMSAPPQTVAPEVTLA